MLLWNSWIWVCKCLSYFLFLFKSLPQEFVKLKIWQCSLLLIVVSCLFEFCRETSPSLVSGVMLLPHFSQSQANPWWEAWRAPWAQVLLHGARVFLHPVVFNLQAVWRAPPWAQMCIGKQKSRTSFVIWLLLGELHMGPSVPWQVESPSLPDETRVLGCKRDQFQKKSWVYSPT